MTEEVRILISCVNPDCKKEYYKVVSVVESTNGVDYFVEDCIYCTHPIKVKLQAGYVLANTPGNKKDVYRGK